MLHIEMKWYYWKSIVLSDGHHLVKTANKCWRRYHCHQYYGTQLQEAPIARSTLLLIKICCSVNIATFLISFEDFSICVFLNMLFIS